MIEKVPSRDIDTLVVEASWYGGPGATGAHTYYEIWNTVARRLGRIVTHTEIRASMNRVLSSGKLVEYKRNGAESVYAPAPSEPTP